MSVYGIRIIVIGSLNEDMARSVESVSANGVNILLAIIFSTGYILLFIVSFCQINQYGFSIMLKSIWKIDDLIFSLIKSHSLLPCVFGVTSCLGFNSYWKHYKILIDISTTRKRL